MKRSELEAWLEEQPRTQTIELAAVNVRRLEAGSPFAAIYQPDNWKAYVEFDICHSLPVIAGPSMEGAYLGYHPAVLANSHRSLIHKQTNLQHLIKAYDPERILKDRIIGAVVATEFPPEPEGGWQIPEKAADAPCIHACAVVFKQAEGARTMLEQHLSGDLRWSVSIEVTPLRMEDIAFYIPGERRIVSLMEADDGILAAISRDANGQIQLGLYQGEQLVFAFGGMNGGVCFQGVGYTPRPAEKEAHITMLRMSSGDEARELPAERMSAGESYFARHATAPEFDAKYAVALRQNWPTIWQMAAGMTPQYGLDSWLAARRGAQTRSVRQWIDRREAFATANHDKTSLRDVVAQIRWGVVGALGMEGMKAAIEAEKENLRKKRNFY